MSVVHLIEHWRLVRRGLVDALDRLSDEQLEFVPRTGLWSLGTVALHIANAEKGWLRYALTRELSEWPPLDDADYPTVTSVKGLLEEVHQDTEAYLAGLDDAELDKVQSTAWGESLSQRAILWHVFEHEVHHRGEIYLMLGLMGMEAPDV